MPQRLTNSKGFTLLELILSLGIVGFIVAISLAGIRLGMSAREAGEKKAEAFQRLRIIGEQLSQKIKSAYPVFVADKTSESFSRDSKPGLALRTLAFEGKPDSLRFISFAVPLTANGAPPWAHEVRVYLGAHPQTGEQGIILMERDISENDIFTEDTSRSQETRHFLLASAVKDLQFRYYTMEEEEPQDAFKNDKKQNNTRPRYKGSWVRAVRYEPPSGLKGDEKPQAGGQKATQNQKHRITLPKGVEIVIGWEGAEASEIRYTPPIVVPLHTGMEFTLLKPEKDATT